MPSLELVPPDTTSSGYDAGYGTGGGGHSGTGGALTAAAIAAAAAAARKRQPIDTSGTPVGPGRAPPSAPASWGSGTAPGSHTDGATPDAGSHVDVVAVSYPSPPPGYPPGGGPVPAPPTGMPIKADGWTTGEKVAAGAAVALAVAAVVIVVAQHKKRRRKRARR